MRHFPKPTVLEFLFVAGLVVFGIGQMVRALFD
jgi:hypothetical protein